MNKPEKRPLNGIVLLDKPIGMSSNKALKKAQYLFRAQKAGHTGSLDPLATGLLPLCFGEATKLSQYLLEADKTYSVTAKLGQRSSTADAEGEIIAEKPVPSLKADDVEKLLDNFRGEIEQTPPIYSALKVDGQALYKYARQGLDVEIKSRRVHIYDLKLISLNSDKLELEVHCSKGTYIRSLVDDLGELIGCGAHVSALRRITTAGYKIAEAVSLETLENADPSALGQYLIPLNSALTDWPALHLNEEEIRRFRLGQTVQLPPQAENRWIKVCDAEANLLGLGEVVGLDTLAPRKVFNV